MVRTTVQKLKSWMGARRPTRPLAVRRRALSLEPLERRELLAVANITASTSTLTENPESNGAFTIRITGLSSGDSGTIDYLVESTVLPDNPPATPGVDYNRYSSWRVGEIETAHFSSTGSSVSIVLPIETINDTYAEGDEDIKLTLISGYVNGIDLVIGSSKKAVITITDDDTGGLPLVYVTAPDCQATEPAEQGAIATDTGEFEIIVVPGFSQVTHVHFTLLVDDEPRAARPESPNADYTLLLDDGSGLKPVPLARTGSGDYTGTVEFKTSERWKTLVVRPNWDGEEEFAEIVHLRIDPASRYRVGAHSEQAVAIMDTNVEAVPSNEELVIPDVTVHSLEVFSQ